MDQQFGPAMQKMSEVLRFLEGWLRSNVLTWQTAAQWLWALVALLLTLAVWRFAEPRLRQRRDEMQYNPLGRALLTGLIRTGGLLLFILLAQASGAAFSLSGHSPWVLDTLSKLTVAGVFIRLFAFAMPSKALARSAATVVWVFVSLHILGLLSPFTGFLESLSYSVGGTTFTAFGALKGLLLAVIFLQGAVALSRFFAGRIAGMSEVSPSVQVLLTKSVKAALFTVAILLALSSVGIDLTSLAIFSSALGVGIGFGLQTIISNYVSGIILLVDKSIKPGDTIEVGGVYGVVRGVFSRYVSVLTRDGKEILVPNEQFVTNEVINWTFSDTNIRLRIPVGVSYGSDVEKALRLMEESVKGVGRILGSPKPVALLIEFGDSSVNLELRAWIGDTDAGVTNVKSEVLLKIWNLFDEHGVEFPFPQRDVLLKPGSSLSVKLDKSGSEAE